MIIAIDCMMCTKKNFVYVKTTLTTMAIFNFSVHLANIVMHIYYYSLATHSGIVLSAIGIVFVLYSMYNYLLVNIGQKKFNRNIVIWKVFCWIETIILFGTSFAEGILILLYAKFLYFEVSIWYLLALCICAVIDISVHLLLLFLLPCCLNKRIEPESNGTNHNASLDDRKESPIPTIMKKKARTDVQKKQKKNNQGKSL